VIAGLIIVVTTFSAWSSWKVTAMSSLVTVMTNRFAEAIECPPGPLQQALTSLNRYPRIGHI
jgi:hypothetical protein